ncbi:hypothetical protein NQ543_01950 [Thomasclavelia spiroformis DSM 1552]|uniref:Uncharacterized protein n=1 Tax=Thomasclavelia spiroformis DSM 1552 TaxID=428126 RepID=B1C075_9FIRM|nr:hypothetical protein [Thomasclavelia spiroformis]EDS75565.1 hypothetical protein CLOSPI_00602 [Thomasclavelia spiroformis DSM 1552]UWO90037.1 hypothetical protein NQ543_01950 [Thomasclavelia spiroformis DSM 1552]
MKDTQDKIGYCQLGPLAVNLIDYLIFYGVLMSTQIYRGALLL